MFKAHVQNSIFNRNVLIKTNSIISSSSTEQFFMSAESEINPAGWIHIEKKKHFLRSHSLTNWIIAVLSIKVRLWSLSPMYRLFQIRNIFKRKLRHIIKNTVIIITEKSWPIFIQILKEIRVLFPALLNVLSKLSSTIRTFKTLQMSANST